MTDTNIELPEQRWTRQYRHEMSLVLVAYAIVLSVTFVTLKHVHGAWRYPIALAPVAPFAGIPAVVYRMIRRSDEMQRDQLLRTFTFCLFGTALLSFAYGFLELVGAPHLSMFIIWPVIGTLWIISGGFFRHDAR